MMKQKNKSLYIMLVYSFINYLLDYYFFIANVVV